MNAEYVIVLTLIFSMITYISFNISEQAFFDDVKGKYVKLWYFRMYRYYLIFISLISISLMFVCYNHYSNIETEIIDDEIYIKDYKINLKNSRCDPPLTNNQYKEGPCKVRFYKEHSSFDNFFFSGRSIKDITQEQ